MSNKIDSLLTALNAIEGLAFVQDAWKDKAPDDYGVVELTGESHALWADEKMVEQRFRAKVHIYVHDGEFDWIQAVQSVLEAQDLYYDMPTREYLYDIHAVHWEWDIWIYGPVTEADANG